MKEVLFLKKEINYKKVFLLLFFYSLIFFLTYPVYFRKIAANDIWKALYSGRYLALFSKFPHHSTYTFSPTQNFLPRYGYTWLGNLSFYGIYYLSGLKGFQIFKILNFLYIVTLLHSMVNWKKHPIFILILVGLGHGLTQKLLIRTSIIGPIGFITLLWIWFHTIYRKNPKALYFIPTLFLIWGNFHGSYIIGYVVLLLLISGLVIDTLLTDRFIKPSLLKKLFLIFLIITLVLLFVRPFYTGLIMEQVFGIPDRIFHKIKNSNSSPKSSPASINKSTQKTNYFQYIYKNSKNIFKGTILKDQSFRTIEFNFTPHYFKRTYIKMYFLFLLGGFLFFIYLWDHIYWDLFITFLAIGLLGLSYIRGSGYLCILTVFIVFAYLNLINFEYFLNAKLTLIISFVVIFLLVGITGFHLSNNTSQTLLGYPYYHVGFGKYPRFESQLPSQVKIKFPKTHFFNNMNQGAYLIWNWWPFKKVFIDSKTTGYKEKFLSSYGEGNPEILEKNNLFYAFVNHRSTWHLQYLSQNNDWRILSRDRFHFIYHLEK